MVKILHVDDEQGNLDDFVGVVEDMDLSWEIVSIDSPIKALSKMNDLNPDLIISDMKMPDLKGSMFIRLAQRIWPYSKFVYLSSHPQVEVETHGHLNFTYLRKPIDRELVNKITKIIETDIDVRVHPIVKAALRISTLKEFEGEKASRATDIDNRSDTKDLSEEEKSELRKVVKDFHVRDVLESNPLCMFSDTIKSEVFKNEAFYKHTYLLDKITLDFVPISMMEDRDFRYIETRGKFIGRDEEWSNVYLLFNKVSRMLYIVGDKADEIPSERGKLAVPHLKFIPNDIVDLAENNLIIKNVWEYFQGYAKKCENPGYQMRFPQEK